MAKTTLVCFACRRTFGYVYLNDEVYLKYYFDFCPTCVEQMSKYYAKELRRIHERARKNAPPPHPQM